MELVGPPADAPGQLEPLVGDIRLIAGWTECVAALADRQVATFDSVWGSSCALLAAALERVLEGPLLVVTADERAADRFQDDLETIGGHDVELFPAAESSSSADPLAGDENAVQRLRILSGLAHGQIPPVMVAPVSALLQPVLSPTQLLSSSQTLRVGQPCDLDDLRQWLVAQRYQAVAAVQLPGEFAARGGIVDVFAAEMSAPVRIEFDGDRIESLRLFDVASQRSTTVLAAIEIGGVPDAADERETLFSYLPREATVVLVEPSQIYDHVRQLTLHGTGDRSYLALPDLQLAWAGFGTAIIERLSVAPTAPLCRLPAELVGSFAGDAGNVRLELERAAREYSIVIVAASEVETQRVRTILADLVDHGEQRVTFAVGWLHEGFRLTHTRRMVVGCDQLFQRSDLRRVNRRRLGKPIDSFLDLRPGELIVHLSHGIGRFRGLKLLEKNGQRSEHLEIEFAEKARIFVPVSKFNLVQKYIGGVRRSPPLARIGGRGWARRRAAAESAVTDMAADLLAVHAARIGQPGIAMPADSSWQFEFEHSFPYQETADQLAAIDAIKQDMQRPRPMDRLLCGDVGFGKTELAMRAAFKAIDHGYQVAVLVPTTVLAEQHYQTFRQRMAEFPVEIQRLSRFCTTAEERATLEGLSSGQVDLVIGTHRLVSADVRFKNLGLLIIDEEQRFGVSVKERLKALRTEVDVLTMSATPIPRTLHMSLVGVRDISNLETPPLDRQAVETKVARLDRDLLRFAILREMDRGGQTYVVHNRVNDIHTVEQLIRAAVPEARLIVAHGQMHEHDLEFAMTEFVAGRYDVLLATTIIENGLDIPNANTILIDQADRYGLADLHQLRGRVGRYKNKAYCYLLIDPHKTLTPNAARRIQAIETYSEIGSGFAIAMRDLEIRGAGNLLGTEQSGHIAAVGYELYCQLLENAVRQLKHLPVRTIIDVDIDLAIEAYLPDDYVGDRRQKLDLYRRLARADTFDGLAELRAEILDRFGPLPGPVERLLELAELRLLAAVWQVTGVFTEERYLGFRFENATRMRQLAERCKGRLRIVDEKTGYMTLKTQATPVDQLLRLVRSILQ